MRHGDKGPLPLAAGKGLVPPFGQIAQIEDLDRAADQLVIATRAATSPSTVTAGIDWQNDDYRVDNYGDHPAARTRPFNVNTAQIGAFVQGRVEFANGIDLSTGMRLDRHRFEGWNDNSFSDSGASANATVSYEFLPGYEVFAGASNTWLGYDIGEYGLLHARDDTFTADPDFDAAKARNCKIGPSVNQGYWTGNVTYSKPVWTGWANMTRRRAI